MARQALQRWLHRGRRSCSKPSPRRWRSKPPPKSCAPGLLSSPPAPQPCGACNRRSSASSSSSSSSSASSSRSNHSTSGTNYAAAWARGYEAFLRSGIDLLALRDVHIAINTATMLLRPSAKVYELGTRVLSSRRFNFSHGFELRGRPRDVLPMRTMAGAEVKRLKDNKMYRVNHWDVVCGDGDQGLFVYVFLVLLQGRTFAFPTRDDQFRVHHFFALHKPWGKKTRCLRYFDFLRDPKFLADGRGSDDPRGRRSHCLRKLEEKRGCLEASTMADAGGAREALCAQCAKNGQKSTCPRRERVRHANGTSSSREAFGKPFCPTAATRWYVF